MNTRDKTLFSLVVILSVLAVILWISGQNQAVFYSLNHSGHALPDVLWSNLTLVADTLFAVAALLILASYHPRVLNQALVLLVIGTLFVHGFKQWLDIMRPAAVLDRDSFYIIGRVLKTHSFPSGHSFTAMSCAGLIWLNSRRLPIGVAALIIGFMAALSRAMVGAHWPLDILVGSAAGLLIAWFSVYLVNRWPWLQGHGQKLFTAAVLTIASAYLSIYQDGYPGTSLLALIASIWALVIAWKKIWLPLARHLRRAFAGE